MGAVSLDGPIGQGLLIGLKAVAVAVVAHAVWGMAKNLTPDLRRILIGIVAVTLALVVPGNFGQLIANLAGIGAGLLCCRNLTEADVQPLVLQVSRRLDISCTVELVLL